MTFPMRVYVYGSSYTTSMDSIFIENNVINTPTMACTHVMPSTRKFMATPLMHLGTLCYNYLLLPLVWCGCSEQYHELRYGLWFLYLYLAPVGILLT